MNGAGVKVKNKVMCIVQYYCNQTRQQELVIFSSKEDATEWRKAHQDALFLAEDKIDDFNKEFKYRIIYKDDQSNGQLAIFTSEQDATAWCIGHIDAFIVNYLVKRNGHEIDAHINSKEKAEEIASSVGGFVHVMSPGNLDSEATDILYGECQ